jgi:hypothetical protein
MGLDNKKTLRLAISPQKNTGNHWDLNTQITGFQHQDLGLQQQNSWGLINQWARTLTKQAYSVL